MIFHFTSNLRKQFQLTANNTASPGPHVQGSQSKSKRFPKELRECHSANLYGLTASLPLKNDGTGRHGSFPFGFRSFGHFSGVTPC